MKRYQECNWIVKQFRKRWYLTVPFVTLYWFIAKKRVYIDEIVDNKLVRTDRSYVLSWTECWKISIGDAQGKMKYYWTHEEVKDRMKARFGDLK